MFTTFTYSQLKKMQIIPREIKQYLHTLKSNKRNEEYETLTLMLMNSDFLDSIKKLLSKSISSTIIRGEKVSFKVFSNDDYEDAIDKILGNPYFKKTFQREELEKKSYIIKNILIELVSNSVLGSIMNGLNDSFEDVKFNTTLENLKFPLITHKYVIENSIRKYKMTFPRTTTKSELYKYIDDNLDLKSSVKKKKMSFGLGLRLLEIENEIVTRKSTKKGSKHEYIEQLIAEELFKKYGERMSVDAIKKTILRTKKMVAEMNKDWDK